MSEIRKETQSSEERIAEYQERLNELLEEKIDMVKAIYFPELTTSGVTLAEYYSTVIQLLEAGKDPDKYYRVSSAHPSMVKIQFGYHPQDHYGKTYRYNFDGNLKEVNVEESVSLWRKKGLPDYVREQLDK